MKILLISDLHICTEQNKIIDILKNKEYDCILSLGDNLEYDLNLINTHAKNVPIYNVFGEHNNYNDLNNIKRITNIHNKNIEYNGISFVGLEGCNRYKMSRQPMYDQADISTLIKTLPKADILVTHTGPANICASLSDDDESKHGFRGINEYIAFKKPKYHFHGHYHQNSEHRFWSGTTSYCIYGVSLFDTDSETLDCLYTESDYDSLDD